MSSFDNEFETGIDITRNIKIIEFLKGEMLTDMAELFKTMSKDSKNVQTDTLDIIANVIIESYVLAKRIGLSYDNVALQINEKLSMGIEEQNEIEKYYRDLSELKKFLSFKKSNII